MKKMAFEWLTKLHHQTEKDPDYAEKTLAGYRLGIQAKGSIVGIAIELSPACCESARKLHEGNIYGPQDVPRLPLPECPLGRRCGCVYRPVMSYQKTTE